MPQSPISKFLKLHGLTSMGSKNFRRRSACPRSGEQAIPPRTHVRGFPRRGLKPSFRPATRAGPDNHSWPGRRRGDRQKRSPGRNRACAIPQNQPIRLPGLKPGAGLPSPGPAGFASTAKGGGKAGAGLPSPGPAGFASTAKGGGKAGAGVCSGLIRSNAFTPILKSGFGAVERIKRKDRFSKRGH